MIKQVSLSFGSAGGTALATGTLVANGNLQLPTMKHCKLLSCNVVTHVREDATGNPWYYNSGDAIAYDPATFASINIHSYEGYLTLRNEDGVNPIIAGDFAYTPVTGILDSLNQSIFMPLHGIFRPYTPIFLNLVPNNQLGFQARIRWNDGTRCANVINAGATLSAWIFVLIELDLEQ